MDSLFKPAFMLMSGRALGFVVSFAIPIVLARIFSQSDFGTYKQLFLIYTTLFGIAQVGMAESLYYFLPTAPHQGGRYAANAMLGLALAGSLCLAGLSALAPMIGHWFNNPELGRYIPFIGVFLVLMLTSTVLEIVMTTRKRHLYAFGAYALSDLLRATLCIAPVLWFGGLEAVLWGGILFALLRLAATFWYLRSEFRGGLHPDTPLLKKHLAYALPFALAVLIDITQANLHMYVVSYHFDAATFAIYAVGCLQIPLVDFMMTSTSSVMMVRMREHLQDGNSAAVLRIWDDTTRKLALVFVPLVGGLLVTADPLIPVLFTDRYAGSIQLFMLWTLSILFTALMTDSMLRVYAETRYLILLNLIRLVFVAITISWFLSRFGLLGAVLVTLFATVLSKLVAFIRIKRSLQCSLVQLLPWRSLGATLLIGATAALPTLAIKSALHIPPVPLLLVTGAVYAAAYAGLLILYGPLHSEERLLLLSWARRPVASVCRSLGI